MLTPPSGNQVFWSIATDVGKWAVIGALTWVLNRVRLSVKQITHTINEITKLPEVLTTHVSADAERFNRIDTDIASTRAEIAEVKIDVAGIKHDVAAGVKVQLDGQSPVFAQISEQLSSIQQHLHPQSGD